VFLAVSLLFRCLPKHVSYQVIIFKNTGLIYGIHAVIGGRALIVPMQMGRISLKVNIKNNSQKQSGEQSHDVKDTALSCQKSEALLHAAYPQRLHDESQTWIEPQGYLNVMFKCFFEESQRIELSKRGRERVNRLTRRYVHLRALAGRSR